MLLAVAVMVALCGCGSTGKAGDTKPQGGAVATEDKLEAGGSVVVAITQDFDSLDPHKAVAAGTKEVLYNIFEGLIKVDTDGSLVPAVAESCDISEDGMLYSFALRKGVKFHNGKEVTAKDVIYSFNRCANRLDNPDPEIPVIKELENIESVEETENGVAFRLVSPNTELLAKFNFAIIPEGYEEQASHPVGCGPFKFESYTPGVEIVLAKNPDYRNPEEPKLDKVTFKIFASSDAAFMDLVAGSVDILPYLSEEHTALAQENNIDVLTSPMNMIQALFINNSVAPFDNVKVRQALNYAVDRETIVQMQLGGDGSVTKTGMFSSFERYYNKDTESAYPYDVEKAKALLAEAGYPDGFEFTIKVPSSYLFHVDTAQILVEQFKAIGVTAKIELIEWASWLSDVYAGKDFEATVIGLDGQINPSDIFRFYPTGYPKNFINYSNPAFDEAYFEGFNAVDDDVKVEAYGRAQQILTDDAASVFIQTPVLRVAISKKLAGYRLYPIYVQDMAGVYFTK